MSEGKAFADALACLVEAHDLEVARLRQEISRLSGSEEVRLSEQLKDLAAKPVTRENEEVDPQLQRRASFGKPTEVVMPKGEPSAQPSCPADTLDEVLTSATGAAAPLPASAPSPRLLTSPAQLPQTTAGDDMSANFAAAGEEQQQEAEFRAETKSSVTGSMYSFMRDMATDELLRQSSDDIGMLARWGSLVRDLLEALSSGHISEVQKPMESYELLPHWLIREECKRHRLSTSFASAAEATDLFMSSELRIGDCLEAHGSACRHFVLHPHGMVRLAWAGFGMMLLVWDAVSIPLQVFDFGEVQHTLRTISFVVVTYWCLDIPLQFFIGYKSEEGAYEMRPALIRRNYLKSWFWPDVLVVGLDVAITLIVDSGNLIEQAVESSSAQAGTVGVRFARLARLLRLVRLLRARRLKEMMTAIFDRLGSEHILLAAKLVKYVVFILLANHYVACGWYGIAAFNDNELTWVSQLGLEDTSAGYQYLLSLHWSLTQFSPSTNNIAPSNMGERFFASCIVCIALLVFSSFISSVTNAVNQLRLVNMEPLLEEARIREFMMLRNVSTDLFARVQHFFKSAYIKKKARAREDEISFFTALPETLMIQMHTEVYMPCLSMHAVFEFFSHMDRSFLRRVAHQAMSELSYLIGQDIFIDGTVASGLYFTAEGRVLYERVNTTQEIYDGMLGMSRSVRHKVQLEEWISEMSLWVAWVHCGRLRASAPSELIKLGGLEFGDIIASHGGPMVDCLRTFAVLVVSHAEAVEEKGGRITDMPLDIDVLQDMAARAQRFSELRRRRFEKESARNRGATSQGSSQSSAENFFSPRSPRQVRADAIGAMSRFRETMLVRW